MRVICIAISFLLLANLSAYSQINILKRSKKKAEYETSKKVNKEIEKVFNPEKDEKPNEPENEEPTTENEPDEKKEDKVEPESDHSNNNPSSVEEKKNENLTEPPKAEMVALKNDFVAGEETIFEDLLVGEQLGEFPSKWDLLRGGAENAILNGEPVISYTTSGEIKPLVKTESFLPEVFTIEFDCYFHMRGNEGYYIYFDKIKSIRINSENAIFSSFTGTATNKNKNEGWRHVSISFNKRALKLYLDGERLLNVPNVPDQPTKVHFGALSHSASKGKPAMIKNIHIAKGGVKLYDRLMTDGRLVLQDIHFDYNKSTLKPESMDVIRPVVEMLKDHPDVKLIIEGHTDGDGSESGNQVLSEERAESVKVAMINLGIKSDRLSSVGYGESQPIADNSTAEGKSKNRRVEMVLEN